MKINLCVLGDSHVAAMKNAWDKISIEYPGLEITFFAARENGLSDLYLTDDCLVPNNSELSKSLVLTSKGKDKIEILNYDIFLVYGLKLYVPNIDARYSESLIARQCSDVIRRSLNNKICLKLKKTTNVPVFCGHKPQKAHDGQFIVGLNNKTYQVAFKSLESAISDDLILLSQPDVTISSNKWNTKKEFSIGSTRLDVGDFISNQLHPNHDVGHMNQEYGVVWLRKNIPILLNSI